MLDEEEWTKVQAVIYPHGERAQWAPFRERLTQGSAMYAQ